MKIRGFTLIELMIVILIINILIAMLLPSLHSMRETTRRGRCQSNMAEIVRALREHEQAFGVLPSGTVQTEGPVRNVPNGDHMGWMARILPFLDQMPHYREIDFSKGVYDPANRTAWQTAGPAVFLCPTEHLNGSPFSNYMACHDGVETPIDADNRGTFFSGSRLRSRDIPDGLSYTIWLGEANLKSFRHSPEDGQQCPSLGWMSGTPGTIRNTGTRINAPPRYADWPMPLDFTGHLRADLLPYRAEETVGQLHVGGYGSFHPGGANFALGDGQVRMLFDTIDTDIYRQLGRRNDAGPHTLGD